jgi:hypothetical protein
MWDFKLRSTRIIFIASIPWLAFSLFMPCDWFTVNGEYRLLNFHWDFFFLLSSPIWVYWIAIPLVRISGNWVDKGK